MFRSLKHYWRINLAVLLVSAVATAVLSGALLVGNSVRESLRDLALDRLGRIDFALVSDRFFREDLSADLSSIPAFEKDFDQAAPAILVRGTAIHAETESRASRVNIHAIDSRFTSLFAVDPEQAEQNINTFLIKKPGQLFPPVIINKALQRELNARVGDPILMSFEKQSNIHGEFLLGDRNISEIIRTVRLTVSKVIPDQGLGRFGLHPHQSLPQNAFVPLNVLQKALNQEDRVNAMFVTQAIFIPEPSLEDMLHQVLKLEDLGLSTRRNPHYFSVESSQFILNPHLSEVAKAVAEENELPYMPIQTYLANTMVSEGHMIPYSTITAITTENLDSEGNGGKPFGQFTLTNGLPVPPLGDDEILLNEWATKELDVEIGDKIEVSYFVVGQRGELLTKHAQFRLRGTVALKGLAANRQLTPEIPGIHDARDMFAWKPPFPLDLNLIRERDERYWDEFGATPKAFVSDEKGRRLWSSRFGNLTAIWIGVPPGEEGQTAVEEFSGGMLERIRPEDVGLVFQTVRSEALEAATGSTDFSMLFIGFSLFLIVSAALLVGLLFRLGVEQRAAEVGILMSSGYPLAAIRRRFMTEGGILSMVGGLIGLGGAIFYAWLMMVGLRSWWVEAIGTPFLVLHVNLPSLLIGYLVALGVVLFSIAWSIRQTGRTPVRALLAGVATLREKSPKRKRGLLAVAALVLSAALIVFALVSGRTSSPGLFFGSGTLLLISGLAFISLWFYAREHREQRPLKPAFARHAQMGARNSARNPGRSLLCVSLVASACFVIVGVGVNRRTDVHESGTGGFALVAESDIPIHQDLNSLEGKVELGFSEADATILSRSTVVPFRLLPGEDASCLNLFRPQKPRILGVPTDLISRGGFQFQKTVPTSTEEAENPWQLLEQKMEPGVVPAMGDYNSVRWILHLGLGNDLTIRNEAGQEVRLRLVGLLRDSIFQSELLISETNFIELFPNRSGYSYFLIASPPDDLGKTIEILESGLNDSGYDVVSTTEKINAYHAVQNTYLSTFQTLGGLGLLLGTVGLGILVLRNIIERRGELAMLRAVGFRRSSLLTVLSVENSFLLIGGLLIGSFSALIAVAPHLSTQIPWISLSLTLSIVFLAGVFANTVASYFALHAPLLTALKGE